MSEVIDKLRFALGKEPSLSDIATHVADSISAQEQLQRVAREQGDLILLTQSSKMIQRLKMEARDSGLSNDTHPSIFKRY